VEIPDLGSEPQTAALESQLNLNWVQTDKTLRKTCIQVRGRGGAALLGKLRSFYAALQ